MRKVSFILKEQWQELLATVTPELHSTPYRYERDGFVIVALNETLWKQARLMQERTGQAALVPIPAPWMGIGRLAPEILAACGPPATGAVTVGDYLFDVIGRDIFRD